MITLSSKEVKYLGLEKTKKQIHYTPVEIDNSFFEWMRKVNEGLSSLNYNSYQTVKVFSSANETATTKRKMRGVSCF